MILDGTIDDIELIYLKVLNEAPACLSELLAENMEVPERMIEGLINQLDNYRSCWEKLEKESAEKDAKMIEIWSEDPKSKKAWDRVKECLKLEPDELCCLKELWVKAGNSKYLDCCKRIVGENCDCLVKAHRCVYGYSSESTRGLKYKGTF